MELFKKYEQLKRESDSKAAVLVSISEFLFVVVISVAVTLVTSALHCYNYWDCNDKNTCGRGSKRHFADFCSFTNVVTFAGDAAYNNSASVGAHISGVCAPGERMTVEDGDVACAAFRSYPNALETAIQDPGAATYHERYCGKWISAGVSLDQPSYWSFYEEEKWRKAVLQASEVSYGDRLSRHNIGKFRATCQSTVLAGTSALRASAKIAYQYLVDGFHHNSSLETLGWIASHHCDAPVQISVANYGDGFNVRITDGPVFVEGALSEALYAMEQSSELRALAESANAHVNSNAWNSPAASIAQIKELVEGSTEKIVPEYASASVEVTPQFDGFLHLAAASPSKSDAFLRGVAAMCSYSLSSSIAELGYPHVYTRSPLRSNIEAVKRSKPKARALGRLSPPAGLSPFQHIENATIQNASVITIAQIVGAPLGNANYDCIQLTRSIFPDKLDQNYFNLVVTPKLYDRLEDLVSRVRAAVANTLRTHPTLRAALVDPDFVASSVELAKVRIPGAPRGSWAGADRTIPSADFNSNDGVFLMALKQSRAVFLDRMNELALENTDLCSGPPVYDSMETNAFIYPGFKCSFYLLGILRMPFADEHYDDVSLHSRIGYVVAHEFAHLTLLTNWITPNMQSLLSRYTSNVYSEALADVVATLALAENNITTQTETCAHVSQMWCARVPPLYRYPSFYIHPAPNVRGDAVCDTLSELVN